MTTKAGELPQRFDGRVIVDSRYAAQFDEQAFEPAYWEAAGAIAADVGGRGQVLFVESGSEHWVLRHYHRGGMMTPALGDRYFWQGADRTRSLREWRLLHRLHSDGLPVPRPIAARFVRDGLFYRADLITARIPATRSVAAIAAERLLTPGEWQAIGRCIRRFHDAGVFHADLNAHNILLDEAGDVFLVDFDRGCIRRGGARWKKANLRRLNRSLHKIGLSLSTPEFEQRQWPALLGGYAQPVT